jgi:hypothetical protein
MGGRAYDACDYSSRRRVGPVELRAIAERRSVYVCCDGGAASRSTCVGCELYEEGQVRGASDEVSAGDGDGGDGGGFGAEDARAEGYG